MKILFKIIQNKDLNYRHHHLEQTTFKWAAILTDADCGRIVAAVEKLWDTTPPSPTQFGDGHAAEKILENIISILTPGSAGFNSTDSSILNP